jgi:hypothetical protein
LTVTGRRSGPRPDVGVIRPVASAEAKLDAYTKAHLTEAGLRIAKALDADYIYNAGDFGGGGGCP